MDCNTHLREWMDTTLTYGALFKRTPSVARTDVDAIAREVATASEKIIHRVRGNRRIGSKMGPEGVHAIVAATCLHVLREMKHPDLVKV